MSGVGRTPSGKPRAASAREEELRRDHHGTGLSRDEVLARIAFGDTDDFDGEWDFAFTAAHCAACGRASDDDICERCVRGPIERRPSAPHDRSWEETRAALERAKRNTSDEPEDDSAWRDKIARGLAADFFRLRAAVRRLNYPGRTTPMPDQWGMSLQADVEPGSIRALSNISRYFDLGKATSLAEAAALIREALDVMEPPTDDKQ